ncbi:MAG: hypothetical protein CUN54_08755 [Phototrophicales bacterium]|nr:MAG: hypothetical protein CUN54_08755 [Phototrophicales bacterium]
MRGLSILPALAVQDAGVKIVFSLESHWLAHSRLYYVNEPNRIKRLYRSAQITLRRFEELRYDAATFSSESLRQSHEDVGVIFDQQAVIPNFIWKNVNIASGKETVGQPLRLLYAGRFSYAKGTDVAVNAVAHLVNAIGYRDVHLTLIGHGDEAFTQHLHEIIRTAHLEAYVDIRGFMPHDELMQCYADFDVLLFPTPEWEGFGMTILEAMSQGVPAIASNIGGPRDIVQHERTGLLVPPSDPAAMAAAIHDLAQSSDKLLTMSQAGVDVVKQHYAADIALKRFDEFLRRVGESASAEEVRF